MPTRCWVAPEMPPRCRRRASRPCRSGRPGSCRAPSRRRRWRGRHRGGPSFLARASIISNFSASPRPRPPATTMAASSSLGPSRSSTWRLVTVARRWRRRARRAGDRRRAAAGSARPRRTWAAPGQIGPSPVNLVFTLVVPPKTGSVPTRRRRRGRGRRVGDHRLASSLTDRRAGDVAAVVGGAEQDGVGAVAGLDGGGDGRGDRHARQEPPRSPVACTLVAPWRRARRRRRRRHRRRRLDGVAELAGLGEQLEGDGGDLLRRRPLRRPRSFPCHRLGRPQMTLSSSRNSTIFWKPRRRPR
jgi:hypothetical protein